MNGGAAPSDAVPAASVTDALAFNLDQSPNAGGSVAGSFAVTGWISLAMFVEGFELQLVGYAAPAMIAALHVSKAQFGVIFGAGNLGFFCGALLLSALGDCVGRRTLILGGVVVFSGCTLSAAYGTSVWTLALLRFGAGTGLGGAVPNAIALTTEYAPYNRRASRVTFLYVTYVLGGAAAGFLAAYLIPKHGWPIIFTIGGCGGFLCGFLVYAFVPESASFLAQRQYSVETRWSNSGKRRDAATTIRKREALFAALFRGGRLWITLLLWLSYLTAMIASQFITSWLPTLIAGTGAGISRAAAIGSLYHVGGAAGNILMGRLVDWRGLKMVAVGLGAAAFVVAWMGLISAALPLLAAATLGIGILVVGSLNGINAAAGMLYPTAMRSSGIGWMSGVGRVGSILGPVVGGIMISASTPLSTLFLVLAAPVALAAISMGGLVRVANCHNGVEQ
jgi:MFS transporter, AAHS family, 4-hydroxybenzoate transporter